MQTQPFRNIIAHKNQKQHQNTMLLTFGSATPTLEELYQTFSHHFPYLYLHSEMIHRRLNRSLTFDLDNLDIFFAEYLANEEETCKEGMLSETLMPLRQHSLAHMKLFKFDRWNPYSSRQ